MSEQKQIHGLMVKVMEEIGVIGKGRENKFDHYKFRGIDDVYNAVNPAMVKHGIFCLPRVLEHTQEPFKTAKGAVMLHTKLRASYTFYAPDGSFVVGSGIGEGMDRGDKSMNKAMSSAYKNVFFEAFCIPTEGDNDTENESPEIAQKQAKSKPAPKAAKLTPWMQICKDNKETADMFKAAGLNTKDGNALWKEAEQDEDKFKALVRAKHAIFLADQKDIENQM